MRRIIDYFLDRPPLLVLIVVGLIWIFIQAASSLGDEPTTPQITIKNAGLCLNQYGRLTPVNTLSMHDEQYVCADLESDTYPIHITLLIYKRDGIFAIQSADNQFTSDSVSFQIFLPAGKYRAKIMYARRVLAEFEFNVVNE